MFLYLVRHGQSTYNAQQRIQGQSDPALSELGRHQGKAVAQRLVELPITAIHASPLRRAAETAQFVAAALNLVIRFDPRLKEVDAGHFQDRIRDDVMREYPDAIPRWQRGDLEFAFPGGESRRELIRRGHEALRAIIDDGHDHAAVVAHGGLLLAAMKALLDIPSDVPPFDMKNASITRLSVDADGCVELLDFDNVAHLQDVM